MQYDVDEIVYKKMISANIPAPRHEDWQEQWEWRRWRGVSIYRECTDLPGPDSELHSN